MSDLGGRAYLKAVVRGRVQGVGFRWWVYQLASELRLVGRVSNQQDGTVLVMAEGSREGLEDLASQLHEGPRYAYVVGVDSEWQAANSRWKRFRIDHI